MKILLMAPQSFYMDRGTPIAVDNLLKVMSERGDQVDVVAYHEGQDVHYPGVTIHRTPNVSFITNIPAGFSWKKIICDFLMIFTVLKLVTRNKYELVHAVEESVFIAMITKMFFRLPYIYDMDSSLAQQMVEQMPALKIVSFIFEFFEKIAVKQARAVAPVCDALAADVERYSPNKKVVILNDVSNLKDVKVSDEGGLRKQLRIDGVMLMYVGNLQTYQGIDLLLESFALAMEKTDNAHLVIIGGANDDIEKYLVKAYHLGILPKVRFLGPRPLSDLADYLAETDIVVSPRTKGQNTPMKVYSYLHSGKPMLATAMRTHTQVVDNTNSMLTEPTVEKYAEGMVKLIEDEQLRVQIGTAGKNLIEANFSYPVFQGKLNQLFDWLKKDKTTYKQQVSYSSK
ncbi:MAG: glycosyltransferase [Chloroflexi bacterium]|nr:MAG: glycosyltransferase [Chloroflexota bacterium]